ncbi:hypothetical protein EDC96DRAFT_574951 [Choanephora cucurbitarum]|nr:hypothetical protein EDC96DRAFT_574951 [Choanephora cucurbitarum]
MSIQQATKELKPYKQALTDTHKRNSSGWAKEHLHWTPDQWTRVVWFDESRYSVQGADGGARVLRRVGGAGPVVDGTMNRAKYIEVLSESFQPWLMELQSQHGRHFIFQEDGATMAMSGFLVNKRSYEDFVTWDDFSDWLTHDQLTLPP